MALCGLELHHGATALRAADGSQWLRLTGGAGSVGAVWHAAPLPLARGFEVEARLRWLGASEAGLQGGMALVLHNDPRGTLALGCGGLRARARWRG